MWQKQSAWHTIESGGRFGREAGEAGVVVEPLHNAEMLGLMARHGAAGQVASTLQQRLGVALPLRPAVVSGRSFDVMWSAPDQWLAFSPTANELNEIKQSASDTLAIVEQTGARAVLRVSGPCWRRAFAKGCPLDLHSDAFPEGHAASTVIGLIGVNLWRRANDDGLHVAVFRSMAGSFWHWLRLSSEEFGLRLIPGKQARL
jgi:sarcosine oxidase subunit gamma